MRPAETKKGKKAYPAKKSSKGMHRKPIDMASEPRKTAKEHGPRRVGLMIRFLLISALLWDFWNAASLKTHQRRLVVYGTHA